MKKQNPSNRFFEGWLEDLKHANEMAEAPPGWQAPCFKPKEVKESSSTSKTTSLRFDLPPVPGTASSEAPSKTLEALGAAWSKEIPMVVYTLQATRPNESDNGSTR